MVLEKIPIVLYIVKITKITKGSHAYKDCASTYNVENLNSFGTELQLKDTESGLKIN